MPMSAARFINLVKYQDRPTVLRRSLESFFRNSTGEIQEMIDDVLANLGLSECGQAKHDELALKAVIDRAEDGTAIAMDHPERVVLRRHDRDQDPSRSRAGSPEYTVRSSSAEQRSPKSSGEGSNPSGRV